MAPDSPDQLASRLSEHLEKLPHLVAAVECGSILAASRRLALSQPAVVRSLQKLEKALHLELLSRSRSGVVPTSQGAQVYEFAIQILGQLQQLALDLLSAGESMTGAVTIGTHEIIASYLWPLLVRAGAERWPQLKFLVKTDFSVIALQRQLLEGALDFAITVEYKSHPRLIHEVIYEEDFAFFKSPQLRLEKNVSPKKLRELPLIYTPQVLAGPGKNLQQALNGVGLEVVPAFEASTFESAISLCSQGMGIAILPKHSSRAYVKAKMLERISVSGVSSIAAHKIWVWRRRSDAHATRLERVLETLHKILR